MSDLDLSLRGYRVLVAEDEYLLADELRFILEEAGATVLGPVSTVGEAIALLEADADIHGAVLDVNLRGQKIFPVAEALESRGVPFVFTTGYERSAIPPRYAHIRRNEKPFDMIDVARAIAQEIAAA